MQNSIRTRLALFFIGLALGPLLVVGLIVGWQSAVVQQAQALELQSEVAQRAATQASAFIQELENELQVTIQVQNLLSLDYEQQRTVLSKLQSYKDVFDDLTLLDGQGQELARVSQRTTVGEAGLGDRSQAPEFTTPMTSGETYYSFVRFDEETGEPFMTMAVPIVDVRTGTAEGVLVADIRMKAIWDLIADIHVGETGSALHRGPAGKDHRPSQPVGGVARHRVHRARAGWHPHRVGR